MTIVRLATKHDVESLLKMPPYLKGGTVFPFKEDILVAERGRRVLGAISVSHKDITCLSGEWKDKCEQHLNGVTERVSGRWISKLYVFPEYRYQGVGTNLVEQSVEFLKEKGFSEAYAGIYIKNEFREISQHIFEKNGFERIGWCVCSLPEGYCRGVLLKRIIKSSA